MSEWAGLGYDGEVIERGLYTKEEPQWSYTNQLARTSSKRETQRESKANKRKSEMDLLWEGWANG